MQSTPSASSGSRSPFSRTIRSLFPVVGLAFGASVFAISGTNALAGPSKTKEASAAKTPKRSVPAAKEVAKKIDGILSRKWTAAKIRPARQTSDAEFLRRISLDLTGAVPSEELTRRFLKSTKHGKRDELIKELLASKAYARTMGLRWAYTLVGRQYLLRIRNAGRVMKRMSMRKKMQEEKMGGEEMEGEGIPGYGDGEFLTFSEWLERAFEENRPFDQVTSDLLSASGTPLENPAVHYTLRFARNGKAPEMTGHVMRVFQGLQLQCAQCHDDKYEPKWTQRVFWGVAAFFQRTTARRLPPPGMTRQEARKAGKRGPFQVWDRPAGQTRIPAPPGETGRLVLPEFVTGEVISPGNGVNRRAELAKLLTGPNNPYFAKAIVNRVWSYYFERGIIDPVDAINQDDYALPELMKLLENDFRDSGYDLRRLVEILVRTRAYQLSSEGPEKGREAALELFARAPLRRLSAEQLFYSVLQVTGVEDVGNGNRRARRNIERMKFKLLRDFVSTFGTDDEDEETMEEGTIPQALMRLNGLLTNKAVQARPGHPVYDRLFRMPKLETRINTIYLRVLSRFPTKDERKKVKAFLTRPGAKKAAAHAQSVADVFWALLNSTEFNLNH